jgi:hypothetical protein
MLFNRHLFLQTFLVCLPRFYIKPVWWTGVLLVGMVLTMEVRAEFSVKEIEPQCPSALKQVCIDFDTSVESIETHGNSVVVRTNYSSKYISSSKKC